MSALPKLLREIRNVRRLLPAADYRRWLFGLMLRMPQVIARRSLGTVDDRFGESIKLRHEGKVLQIEGASLGVVREIFGHECYCPAAELKSCRQILDLGANAGVFGLFALSAAPDATVHMVEAQVEFMSALQDNMVRNGYASRSRIENALVGGEHNEWTRQLRGRHPTLRDFSMTDYLAGAGKCDFVKCDIEGAEYSFFSGDLSWLARVHRIALEYHGSWEQGRVLGQRLRGAGFVVRQTPHRTLGYLHATRI